MRFTFLLLTVPLLLSACASTDPNAVVMPNIDRLKQLPSPAPLAVKIEHTESHHGQTLSDPYHWLKDQGYPEVNDQPVLDYLTAENAYLKEFLDPHKKLVDTIFEEFKGRTDDKEESVPYIKNGFEYRWYYNAGQEYPVRSRTNLATGKIEVFLDENQLAEGHDYFDLGDWEISPDNRYLAYSFNTAGDERHRVRFVDLTTGSYLVDELSDVSGDIAFSADGKSLMYSLLEKDRWHSKHIKVHQIGTEQAADRTVFYEDDNAFFIGFSETSSKEFMVIVSSQNETTESYVLPADFSGEPIKLVGREQGFSQQVDHAHGEFYILANDTHKNFRLAKVSDQAPQYQNWQTIQAGSDDVYLLGVVTFKDFLAVKSRDLGLDKIHIRGYDGQSHEVKFPEPVFTAAFNVNSEFDQPFVRLGYESMISPDTVYDYDVKDRRLITRKVKNIPSGYDKADYQTERIMVTARDGAQVPVSLVYKKGFKQNASQPLWLYAYGAYSATIDPGFSTERLSALDRGFVFAIAHVRGGSMMGYQWYLDGKLEKRPNTFNDFIDVAQHLIKENYVAAGNISASGRSAGGKLMGAVTIQAPELWRSVNLGVPFVDVLNTMLDASLPLTPPEWQEWGNPIESAEAYALLKSYSPYDNIERREYPPMFVSGGINDPRVTYWEPAKWTAKMRELKTDDNLLVMRINMGAGHFANSGRYGRLRDYAEEYAFMFLAHGIDK